MKKTNKSLWNQLHCLIYRSDFIVTDVCRLLVNKCVEKNDAVAQKS